MFRSSFVQEMRVASPGLAQERFTALRRFYGKPRGACLLSAQMTLLAGGLAHAHGRHLLWLGDLRWPLDAADCAVSRVWSMATAFTDAAASGGRRLNRSEILPAGVVDGCWQRLPFASESMAAVVLVHALDSAEDPYGLLRELDRVLMDDGLVLVLSAAPLSLWPWSGSGDAWPWSTRLGANALLKDRLALLGYRLRLQQGAGPLLPPWRAASAGWVACQHSRAEAGSLAALRPVQLLVAQKTVLPMTRVGGARWRRVGGLAAGKVAAGRIASRLSEPFCVI